MEELEQQGEVFKEILEEKDSFIQEMAMEIAEKENNGGNGVSFGLCQKFM